MGTIEQTCRADQRMTRKEACNFIAQALRLAHSTVTRKTIYSLSDCRTGANKRFFDKAKVIDWVNRQVG